MSTKTSQNPIVFNAPAHFEYPKCEPLHKWIETDAKEGTQVFVLCGEMNVRVAAFAASFFHQVSLPIRLRLSGKSLEEIGKSCKNFWIISHPSETQYSLEKYSVLVKQWLESQPDFLLMMEYLPGIEGVLPRKRGHILFFTTRQHPIYQGHVLPSPNKDEAPFFLRSLLPKETNHALLVEKFGLDFSLLANIAFTLSRNQISIKELIQETEKNTLYSAFCTLLEKKKPHHFRFLQICARLYIHDIPYSELIHWRGRYQNCVFHLPLFFEEKGTTCTLFPAAAIALQATDCSLLSSDIESFFKFYPTFSDQLWINFLSFYLQSSACKSDWLTQKKEELFNLHSDLFFKAIELGDLNQVKLFIDAKMDLNTKNRNGFTPLAYSITYEQATIFSALLEADADVNATSLENRIPPILYAIDRSSTFYLEGLIRAKANLDQAETKSKTTALHIAALSGNLEALNSLLQNGADFTCKAANHATPLCSACVKGHLECARALLEKGAMQYEIQYGLLFIAVSENNEPLAALLLDYGAEVDCRNKERLTPLMSAAKKGCVAIVQTLLKHGADTSLRDSQGNTAFDHAVNDVIRKILNV